MPTRTLLAKRDYALTPRRIALGFPVTVLVARLLRSEPDLAIQPR
jgi:hypothetical protein